MAEAGGLLGDLPLAGRGLTRGDLVRVALLARVVCDMSCVGTDLGVAQRVVLDLALRGHGAVVSEDEALAPGAALRHGLHVLVLGALEVVDVVDELLSGRPQAVLFQELDRAQSSSGRGRRRGRARPGGAVDHGLTVVPVVDLRVDGLLVLLIQLGCSNADHVLGEGLEIFESVQVGGSSPRAISGHP